MQVVLAQRLRDTTGKELAARAIHQHSPRKGKPMLKGKLSEPYRSDSKPASAPVAAPSSIDVDF